MEKVKTNTGGANHTLDFKPNKSSVRVPRITESYIDTDDVIKHVLDNGVVMPASTYERTYGPPVIKGEVIPKGYKGNNPNSRILK